MGVEGTGLISRIGRLFKLHDPQPARNKGSLEKARDQRIRTIAERISSEMLRQMRVEERKGATIDLHG
jgi:hypothetical protein